MLVFVALLWPAAAFSQEQTKQSSKPMSQKRLLEMHEKGRKPPTGASFYIEAVGENQARFSLLISDQDKRTVADTFIRPQIEIFEAVMVEAKKFAESNEAVGTRQAPKTTRFVDKNEQSFIIDVEKIGDESRFYITLKCLTGKITVDTGAIKRNNKPFDPPLFLNILTKVHEALAATPPQQG